MRVDVAELMAGTVTVANRVPAEEAGAEDVWRTTALAAFWHEAADSTLSSSGGIADGTASIAVQIAAEDADGYVEPDAYGGDGWTLRPGDKVVGGEVAYEGTLDGLLEACAGLRVGTVSKAEDLRLAGASGLGGAAKWASVLYCEAV